MYWVVSNYLEWVISRIFFIKLPPHIFLAIRITDSDLWEFNINAGWKSLCDRENIKVLGLPNCKYPAPASYQYCCLSYRPELFYPSKPTWRLVAAPASEASVGAALCFKTRFFSGNQESGILRQHKIISGTRQFLAQGVKFLAQDDHTTFFSGNQVYWGTTKLFQVKFGPSEKGTKFENIFYLKFDATE